MERAPGSRPVSRSHAHRASEIPMRHVLLLSSILIVRQAVAQEIVPLEKRTRSGSDGLFLAAGATSTETDDLLRSVKAQGGGAMSTSWGSMYVLGTTTGLRPM